MRLQDFRSPAQAGRKAGEPSISWCRSQLQHLGQCNGLDI
jgi:hypothetical protein